MDRIIINILKAIGCGGIGITLLYFAIWFFVNIAIHNPLAMLFIIFTSIAFEAFQNADKQKNIDKKK